MNSLIFIIIKLLLATAALYGFGALKPPTKGSQWTPPSS
jgi:hypothetical protein